jgi:hypothetical protein
MREVVPYKRSLRYPCTLPLQTVGVVKLGTLGMPALKDVCPQIAQLPARKAVMPLEKAVRAVEGRLLAAHTRVCESRVEKCYCRYAM